MKRLSVIVIGRGIVGLATAYELLEAGHQVTLVGKPLDPTSGSHASMGFVCTKAQTEPRKPLFALKMQGQKLLPDWLGRLEKATAKKIIWHKGVFEPFVDDLQKFAIEQRVFQGKRTNEHPVSIVESDSHPFLAAAFSEWKGAFKYHHDLWIHGPSLLKALEAFISKHSGARIVDNLVTTCEGDVSGRLQVLCEKENQVLTSDEIVLACGYGGLEILRRSGFKTFGLKGLWGQSLVFPSPTLPAGAAFLAGKKTFVSNGNEAWFGSIDHHSAPSEAELCSGYNDLKREAQKLGLLRQNVESISRLGVRLYKPDRAPLIGPLRHPDSWCLFVNLAHHKNGFAFAYPSARIIRDTLSLGTHTLINS